MAVNLLDVPHFRDSMRALYKCYPTLNNFCPDPFGRIERQRVDDPFHALIRIVIGQQISTHAAASIWARFIDRLGRAFTPTDLKEFTVDDYKTLGLSTPKAKYVEALVRAIHNGTFSLPELSALSRDDLSARITALKGFGVWSADMFALFTMMRLDIWPSLDLGVRHGFEIFQGLPKNTLSPEECAVEGAKVFGIHLSAAAICMWDIKANHKHIEA